MALPVQTAYDFGRLEYVYSREGEIVPVTPLTTVQEETTLATISELATKVLYELTLDTNNYTFDWIAKTRKFARSFEEYKCQTSIIYKLILALPPFPCHPISRLQQDLNTLFERKSERVRVQYEAFQEQDSPAKSDCARLYQQLQMLTSVHPTLYNEEWFCTAFRSLKRDFEHLLLMRSITNEPYDQLIDYLVMFSRVESDLSWVRDTPSDMTARCEELLFKAFRKGQEVDVVANIVKQYDPTGEVAKDFSVLLKALDPLLYQPIIAKLEIKAPEEQKIQPMEGMGTRKRVDASLDASIPDDLDENMIASCLQQHFSITAAPTVHKIVARMKLLARFCAPCNISKTELVKIAHFIEVGYFKPECQRHSYFKKNIFQLPCTIASDRVKRVHYLLLKSRSSFSFWTKHKKFSLAISIPQEPSELAHRVVQAVPNRAHPRAVRAFREELEILQRIQGHEAIWPLLYGDETRPTFFSLSAEDDLDSTKRTFTLDEQTLIAEKVIEGVKWLHKKGLLHADLKENNVLVRPEENGTLRVGLIDFGLSLFVDRKHRYIVFPHGFYGTAPYTAPELFGERRFTGNYYKLDSWALGILLYRFVYKKPLPWEEMLWHYHDKDAESSIPQYAKDVFREVCTRFTVEGNQTKLSQLITSLLIVDPERRYQIEPSAPKL